MSDHDFAAHLIEHHRQQEARLGVARCVPPACPPEETFEFGPLVPLGECGHNHPSAFAEWHCEAEAEGITTTHCSPDNPVHSAPCGWRT